MIYVVLDSNVLHRRYEKMGRSIYDTCTLHDVLADYLDIRDNKSIRDEMRIVIPEMVVKELVEQKVDQYRKDINSYSEVALRLGVTESTFEEEKKVRDRTLSLVKAYLEENEIATAPICSENNWLRIVNKAIYKEAPFEGIDKQSDKGFKDTVIFYSIAEYAYGHKGSYYFVTQDHIFDGNNCKKLKQEFFEYSDSSLKFIKDAHELKRNVLINEINTDIPQIFYKIEKRDIIRNSDENKIPITIKRENPVFDSENSIGALINEEIEAQWKKYMGFWKSCDEDDYIEEFDTEYEGSFKVSVKNNEDFIISVHFAEYMFAGGAHGGTTIYARTYSSKKGKLLSITDVLNMDINKVKSLINDCVNSDIKNNKDRIYFEDAVEITDVENVVFYVMNKEVHIVFNEYELAPYSEGTIDLILCELGE